MTCQRLLSSPAFVGDLADAGYLAYGNGRFQLTPAGKAALDKPRGRHDHSPLYTHGTDGACYPTHLGAIDLLGELAAQERR